MLDYPQLPSDLFQGSYRPLVLDWDELRVRDCNTCSHLGQSPAAARGRSVRAREGGFERNSRSRARHARGAAGEGGVIWRALALIPAVA
jgi:hypothetical protein